MASVVDIFNKALSLLGQEQITSIDEDSPQAIACRNLWPGVRDEVQRGYKWNCVSTRATLNQLLESPAFEFQYSYQLPADCLMVNELIEGGEYEVEEDKLLCNSSTASIKYSKRQNDSTKYDAQLSAAYSYLMAAEMCYPMTSSASLSDAIYKMAMSKLADAKATNSFEGKKRERRGNKLLGAKFGR